MAVDLVIDIENTPGALAQVAAAISDAGINIAAATCLGPGERAELHILVPHAGAAKHLLGISHLAVTREREVVVVDVEDRPGVLADLTRRIARAGEERRERARGARQPDARTATPRLISTAGPRNGSGRRQVAPSSAPRSAATSAAPKTTRLRVAT